MGSSKDNLICNLILIVLYSVITLCLYASGYPYRELSLHPT